MNCKLLQTFVVLHLLLLATGSHSSDVYQKLEEISTNTPEQLTALVHEYAEKYPQIMAPLLLTKDAQGERLLNIAILPAGLKMVLEHLRTVAPDSCALEVEITDNLKTFLKEFADKAKAGFIGQQTVIFSRQGLSRNNYRSVHMALLVIRVQSQKVEAIHVDSIGNNQTFSSDVRDVFEQHFPEGILYGLDLQRQQDQCSCSAFAMLDFIAHNENNLFSYLEQMKDRDQKYPAEITEEPITPGSKFKLRKVKGIRRVDNGCLYFLPPNFMAPTQSLSQIANYTFRHFLLHDEFTKDELKALAREVSANTKSGQNCLAANTIHKYLSIILHRCLLLNHNLGT